MSRRSHKAPKIKIPPRALNPYGAGPAKLTKIPPFVPSLSTFTEEYMHTLGRVAGLLFNDPPPLDKYAHITAVHIDESRLPPPLTDWRGSRN